MEAFFVPYTCSTPQINKPGCDEVLKAGAMKQKSSLRVDYPSSTLFMSLDYPSSYHTDDFLTC